MATPMMDLSLALLLATLPPGAPASRLWLESAGWIVPAAWATRALLVADLGVLVMLGLERPHPVMAVPVALGAGFLALNALGMVLTDFFLGLLVFHLLVGATGLALRGGARWAGAGLLVLTVVLGLST